MGFKPWHAGALGAATMGPISAAAGYLTAKNTKAHPHNKRNSAILNGVTGTIMGGGAGYIQGRTHQMRQEWERAGKGFYADPDAIPHHLLNKVGLSHKGLTKKQIQSKYREMAKTHHPDRVGGSEEKFKEMSKYFKDLEDHPWTHKLAHWRPDMEYFWSGFNKKANEEDPISKWETPAELAGLGMLMHPSIQHLRGKKPMLDHNYHKLELAGLGVLAAPYAAKAGRWAYNKLKPTQAPVPATQTMGSRA